MFSKDATYKSQNGGYRKYVWAAIGATAAMLGGAALFGNVQTETDFNDDATTHFVNFLSNHRDYHVNMHNTIVDLLEEGEVRKQETRDAIVQLAKSGKIDVKKTTVPALNNGSTQLSKNVEFSKKTTDGTVKPEEVTKNFADSAQFAAEIKQMFPKQYEIVTKLRQDLKIHHFDLGNQIKDVELMATTTKDNLGRSFKKLELRKRYLGSDRLKPTTDAKIWKFEIKNQQNDLATQLEKANAIIAVLTKLQKDCARTADDLNNVLLDIKNQLTKRIEEKQVSIKQLQAKAASIKCGFWEMIFTFGIACKKADKIRNELNEKLGTLKREMAAAEKLNKRFHYFDSLKKLAGTLTQEASGLLDVTKEFKSKLVTTQKELEQDFNDDEIDDQLGDEDFMNDFAEQLWEAMNRLVVQCDKTIADCAARKKRLTDALIWDKIGEEELTMLGDERDLMDKFYQLAAGCNQFYQGASWKLTDDGNELRPTIDGIGKHKHIIMNYARDEFHSVKGSIFNIVDSIIDGQRAIVSVEEYIQSRLKYLERKLDAEPWKFQLKYSTMVTKYCASNEDRIQKYVSAIKENSQLIASKMGKIGTEFVQNSKKDLQSWDCNAMYPEPQEVDIGVPKWLGFVEKNASNFVKKGFEVYNMVKKFIPGGSKAGAGPVPGSPSEMELVELMNIDWGEAKETATGLGKKLLDDMDKNAKRKQDSMEKRRAIWREALNMCEEDKASFKQELLDTTKAIKEMSVAPSLMTSMPGMPDGIAEYSKEYDDLTTVGNTTPEDRERNKMSFSEFKENTLKVVADVHRGFEKAEDLKKTLLQ